MCVLCAVQSETVLCVNIILDKDKRTTTNAIRYRINRKSNSCTARSKTLTNHYTTCIWKAHNNLTVCGSISKIILTH